LTALVRLGIRVRADRAELALAELLPLLGAGAEERELDGGVEYALYAPAGELPSVDDIRSLAGDAVLDVRTEPVPPAGSGAGTSSCGRCASASWSCGRRG